MRRVNEATVWQKELMRSMNTSVQFQEKHVLARTLHTRMHIHTIASTKHLFTHKACIILAESPTVQRHSTCVSCTESNFVVHMV
jgi:hypothetical protein